MPWEKAEAWLPLWRERLSRERLDSEGAGGGAASPASLMRAANPAIIPRNHRIEEAIARGLEGDLAPFHRLLEAVSKPYADRPEFDAYRQAPKDEERVLRTFCGT
jgi:serine/tyrosine/threonine adenylyltransferase